MTESIGKTLKTNLESIVSLNLSEAETNSYPYATYDRTCEYVQSKDGETLRFRVDVTIHIYAKDLSTANGLADQVKAKISQEMHGSVYGASLRTENKDCTTGVWDYEMVYTIVQYQDEPAPAPVVTAAAPTRRKRTTQTK